MAEIQSVIVVVFKDDTSGGTQNIFADNQLKPINAILS